MCLETVYSDEEMARIIADLPEVTEGVVEVWKTVRASESERCYAPTYSYLFNSMPLRYTANLNIAHQKIIQTPIPHTKYYTGFHCFRDKKAAIALQQYAQRHQWSGQHTVIKCLIKKSWITAIGPELDPPLCPITFIAEKAFFPTYPETEASLEDFLAYLETEKKEKECELCQTK